MLSLLRFLEVVYGNTPLLVFTLLWYANCFYDFTSFCIYYLLTYKRHGLCCFILVASQALIVFILYVRCTAINPADPGIMSKFDPRVRNKFESSHGLLGKHQSSEHGGVAAGEHSSPSSAASKRSMTNMSKKSSVEDPDRVDDLRNQNNPNSCDVIGGILCILFSHEDCRKQEATSDGEGGGEDALFCTLCNSEVLCCDLGLFDTLQNIFNFSSFCFYHFGCSYIFFYPCFAINCIHILMSQVQ